MPPPPPPLQWINSVVIIRLVHVMECRDTINCKVTIVLCNRAQSSVALSKYSWNSCESCTCPPPPHPFNQLFTLTLSYGQYTWHVLFQLIRPNKIEWVDTHFAWPGTRVQWPHPSTAGTHVRSHTRPPHHTPGSSSWTPEPTEQTSWPGTVPCLYMLG